MLFPDPWWVMLLALVPIGAFWIARPGLRFTLGQVLGLTLWAIAFGVVEGVVVVYLRAIAATGVGLSAHIADVIRLSSSPALLAAAAGAGPPPGSIPDDLLAVESVREGATLIMLAGGALVVTTGWRERAAAFLWTFALWDLVYYGTLWRIVQWPASLLTVDVLFLMPRPWIAQVWFPLIVSGATALVLAARWRRLPAFSATC